jgi:hypothetical protein
MTGQLRVTELDFDQIKVNLKEFLRTKSEFTDYDFDGSALSVIIDLLAYNTHYNAVIANMLIQELFLDTAVKRQSISLIAKRMGYMPRSYRAPKAVVDLEVFPVGNPSSLTLGKNAKFTAQLENFENANFITRDAITIVPNGLGRYIFEDVPVYEGDNNVFRYVVTNPVVQQFEIPSIFVDTTLVRVYVQESIGSTNVVEWSNANSLVDINSTSKVYFIKLNENLKYEVYFGDDSFGKSVIPGNVIVIDYVATNGPVANNVSKITFSGSVNGNNNTQTTVVTPSFGGSLPETNDQIRTNAQRNVMVQNRAVTESDYISIINQIIPVDSVAVYGGETITPPQYGKVFVSVKQTGTTNPLTTSQKTSLISELKKRAVMSLVHEFIDPTYVYIGISASVSYNATKTTLNVASFNTVITNKIKDFATANLNGFNSNFEYSKLVTAIDAADAAVVSNDTAITMRKEIDLLHGINQKYVFDFNTSIKQSNSKEDNIVSSPIILSSDTDKVAYIDDVDGIMRVFYKLNNQKVTLIENIGTVDYTKGLITINVNTTVGESSHLKFTVVPSNRNFIPGRNNILTVLDADIKTKIQAV